MRRLLFLTALSVVLSIPVSAQRFNKPDRAIELPDIPGYLTLKCDLHIHSVFSDGNVWPSIRVQEAIRDGLDAISLTEHIEYLPHIDDIPYPDRNRAHEIAIESAQNSDLIIIQGSEITRDMPPGHANAIFVSDSNRLIIDGAKAVFREASEQGAFIFWNHPAWTSQRKDGMAQLSEIHHDLLGEGLLNGIEVVNTNTYSDEALQIALDYNLTIIGASDVHGLIDWDYDVPYGGHRPVTLVFAKERSEAGIIEGRENRRTAVWFNNTLIGKEEFLEPLVQSSLEVTGAWYGGETSLLSINVQNNSDVEYLLKNKSDYTLHRTHDVLTLAPHQSTRIDIKTLDRLSRVALPFEVLNAVTAPNTHLEMTLQFSVDED